MPCTELLVPFAIATAIFAVLPGPGMICATAQTLGGGRRAGWRSALGLHIAGTLGLVVNVAFTATDVIAVEASHAAVRCLRSSKRVVTVLRHAAGGLLIGLGVKLALARPG